MPPTIDFISSQTTFVVVVFAVVYLGMFLGGLPRLHIVVDAARRQGIEIDWRKHARVGVPVTIVTLAITAAWLWMRGLN